MQSAEKLETQSPCGPKSPLKGDSLASFDILSPLGRGGHSFVYKARRKSTGELTAIKVIDATSEKARRQIEREVKVHSALSHPNIVRLLGHFNDESYHYLVLEYCEQGELFGHLKACGGRLSEAELYPIAAQIFSGLRYLHSQGIIHRDIKLGNILLGKGLEVKISDFGLATQVSDLPGLTTERLSGTPNYLAPELVLRKQISFAGDLWAAGCVLFALHEGVLPFEEATTEKTLARISKGLVDRPNGMSLRLFELISALMTFEPKNRPSASDAMEFTFCRGREKTRDELTVSTLEPSSIFHPSDSLINFAKSKKTSIFLDQVKNEKSNLQSKTNKSNADEFLNKELSLNKSLTKNVEQSKSRRSDLQNSSNRCAGDPSIEFGFAKSRITIESLIESFNKKPFEPIQKQPNAIVLGDKEKFPNSNLQKCENNRLIFRPESLSRASQANFYSNKNKGRLSVLNRRVGSFCEAPSKSKQEISFSRQIALNPNLHYLIQNDQEKLKIAQQGVQNSLKSSKSNLGGILSWVSYKCNF